MKRFGFSALLSAVYVGLLVYIFSSDFSKENSFLFENAETKTEIANSADPQPATTPQNHLTTDRPGSAESVAASAAALQDKDKDQNVPVEAIPEEAKEAEVQSPEGAAPAGE